MATPSGPQYGVPYTLIGPDGSRAVFNDPSDADYIGALEEVTGLDSAEVRENADNLVGMDGGVHGDFFYGRRPITMSGKIHNAPTASERNTRQTKLAQASNAMRGDATLTWTPDGGVQQYVLVRRQQPLRITGGWVKDFQVSLVAADPRVYSYALNTMSVNAAGGSPGGRSYPKTYSFSYGVTTPSGQILATNNGNALTYPTLTVTGPATNPLIQNVTTGEQIALTYGLSAGESLTIDTLNRTVMLNGTASRYSAVDFINTDWWGMVAGTNDIRISFATFSSGASLRVDWRDAWL